MKAVLFLVFCLSATVLAQEETIRLTIDDFIGFTSVNINIEDGQTFPIVDSDTFTSNAGDQALLGGERTLILEVDSGLRGRQFQSIIDAGVWEYSTPSDQNSAGDCTLQIDGIDGSPNLDVNGLGGVDLTESGLGFAFVISLGTDVETSYTFEIFSPNGNSCTRTVDIPGRPGQPEEDYLINFSAFSGNCDFANVGAIEINVFSDSQVDSVASFFGTFGTVPTTNSRTPTPSRTPSPAPTASNTPSPSPSPSPEVEMCECHCPIFTCALIFDPDDDENNAYYFDDDDEFEIIDDDGNVVYLDETGSGVGIVQVSIAALAVVAAFAF